MLGMKLVCGLIAFITASHSTTSRVSTVRRHAVPGAIQAGFSTLESCGRSKPEASRKFFLQVSQ